MSGPIEIAPYDAAWPGMFDAEAAVLREALGAVALRIDHVGSTAVPGLAAKPVIDIQISVADVNAAAAYRGPLEALGYLFTSDPNFPEYPFFGKPAAYPRTHHIHVCEAGGREERRHLAFREYLRAHPEVAAAYAGLKQQLAPRYQADVEADRAAYDGAKTAFIMPIEQQALREFPDPA